MMLNPAEIILWDQKKPIFNKSLTEDTDILANYINQGNQFFCTLPEKPYRSQQENQLAEQILASCRSLRSQFIDRHVELVYAILTNHFQDHLRIDALISKASERFLGLLPTHEQMQAEENKLQIHKEGLEIDQSIFFRGILRNPKAGAHLLNAMLLPCARAMELAKKPYGNKITLGAISFEYRDNAAYLTINNPHCLNAENNQLVDDMETAVDLALLDDRIKVCVLRGGVMSHPRYQGRRVFCSGINLKDFHHGKISFVKFLLCRELGFISKIFHGLWTNPILDPLNKHTIQKPWIAAVDSFAIGGGMQLLLVFDKIIASNDAYFSLPAAHEGILPGAANFRLSRIIGNRTARQMILSGKKIFAADPEARWLCDEVIQPSQMENAIAAAVLDFNNPAVVENRRMLNFAEEQRDKLREYLAEFSYIQAIRAYSKDVLNKNAAWINAIAPQKS